MDSVSHLWNRDFALWFIGNAQSALGSSLAGLALSFLVLHQTGSAGAMGVTLALGLLPTLLAPLAGTLVDRLPLRLPLVIGNLLRMVIQLGIGLLALRGEANLTPLSLPLINSAAVLNGLISVIYGPASMSVLPGLVPASQITRASGLMSSAGQTATLLGLVGGGVLVSLVGSAPSLIFDGLSFGLMAALLVFVRLPERMKQEVRPGFWSDLRGGLVYVRSRLLLTLLPLLALFINAALAPMEMLVPKRMLELGAGAAGFGTFFALLVGGTLVSSLVVAVLNDRVKPRTISALGMLGLAVGLLLLSLSRVLWQMWGLAVFTGLAVGLTNTGIGVLFATLIEPEYRGRVASLLGMMGTLGQPLTLLALAPVADHISLNVIFAVAGGLTLVGALIWSWALGQSPQDTPPPLSA
jgi:MFS transporter, DHA3 family, macrolide efflux protein